MEKNKTGKYLKCAIGEIILVVVGILIALQINNWNEKQKLDAKAQDYYAQLLDDLKSDMIFSKHNIETVLDLTCGTGLQVFWLVKKGFKVIGSDINSKMLKFAKEKAKNKDLSIRFIKGDIVIALEIAVF